MTQNSTAQEKIPSKMMVITPMAIKFGLVSALATAIYRSMDNIAVRHIFVDGDHITTAMTYLIWGSWMGTLTGLILAVVMGQRLDRNYKGLIFRNKVMLKSAAISGGVSGVGMLFTLWAYQLGDPTGLAALTSLSVIYATFADVYKGDLKWGDIFKPLLICVVGGILAAYTGKLEFTLPAVVLMLLISNPLAAIGVVVLREGVKASDSVNMFLWRFMFISISGTIVSIVLALATGRLEALGQNLLKGPQPLNLLLTGLTFFFVYWGVGLGIWLRRDFANAVVHIVTSPSVVFAIPITLLANWVVPGIFGTLPDEPGVWIIRLFGSALVIFSLWILMRHLLLLEMKKQNQSSDMRL